MALINIVVNTGDLFEVLGRRLAASMHFRWLPGMLTLEGGRCVLVDGTATCPPMLGELRGGRAEFHRGDDLSPPDLRDAATLGCLLALVREAWGEPRVCADVCDWDGPREGWQVYTGERVFLGASEAEALVAAIEGAPPP